MKSGSSKRLNRPMGSNGICCKSDKENINDKALDAGAKLIGFNKKILEAA
jgi:hypothetical protein